MSSQTIAVGDGTALRVRPQRPRSEKRLREITAAAVNLYNDPQVGRDRFTTAMVAEKAGCSIGSVYRYFDDRVALMDAIAPDRDMSPVGA